MFAEPGCPFGFDFDCVGFACGVVVEAAPAIVFGFGDEASGDWVAVDVLDFLDSFLVGVDVEVVVTALPELFLVGGFEFAGGQLFEDLKEGCDGADCRFVCEEMDVLGHEDVGRDTEALLFAGLFEDSLGGVFGGVGLEEGLAAVTAEGDEMEVSSFLVTFEARWHGGASSLHPTLRKKHEGWGTPCFCGGLSSVRQRQL